MDDLYIGHSGVDGMSTKRYGKLMVVEQLERIGLTPKEAYVFTELTRRGTLTAHQLEMVTGINRTTLYSVAKSLVARGLVHEDQGAIKITYTAIDPEEMEVLVEREEKELSKKKAVINKIIPELGKIALSAKFTLPKIKFVEEKKIEEYLYKNSDKLNESTLKYDGGWWGFQDYRFVEHYYQWINDYWAMPSSKKTSARLFTNASDVEVKMAKIAHERRNIKFWDPAEFTGSLWIVGDYIIMINTQEHPFYLIEVHDQILAGNLREVFKQMWKNVN